MSDRKGDWIQTYLGIKFYVLDPRAEEVEIEDIAHALSMQCRFQGMCKHFYSTAEHCVIMARWVLQHTGDYRLARAALLHDSEETYLPDVATPTKREMPEYRAIGNNLKKVIMPKFGVTDEELAEIKQYDTRILTDERKRLFDVAHPWGTDAQPLHIEINGFYPPEAKIQFLEWFHFLEGKINV